MFTISKERDLAQVVEYLKDVPFEVSRSRLYDAAELYDGFVPGDEDSFANCYDTRAYRHFISKGKQSEDVKELLARTLHDHGIHVALNDFFKHHNPRHCVGVMGGHALLRTDKMFREIVLLSKRLTEQGFCMLTGGGPGAMEATHLGAWMAGRSEEEVGEAGFLRKGAVFKIGDVFGILGFDGDDPGDVALDIFGGKALHDRDALIALDQVVIAHVFQHLGRVPEAFGFDAFEEGAPFGGELGRGLKDGHEVMGEGVGTAAGDAADDPAERDGLDAKGEAVHLVQGREGFLQDREVGVGVVGEGCVIGSQAFFSGFDICSAFHKITINFSFLGK